MGEERGDPIWQEAEQGSLSSPYPSWLMHTLHSAFCLKIDLQWLQVAKKACFKAGFEVEKKRPCLKPSPRQVMLSEGSLVGKKFPTEPCLFTPADGSIAGMVPLWLSVIYAKPLTHGLHGLLRGIANMCQAGDCICDIETVTGKRWGKLSTCLCKAATKSFPILVHG